MVCSNLGARVKIRKQLAAVALVVLSGFVLVRLLGSSNEIGVRNPYLQNDTGTDISICWTTQTPLPTEVEWRPAGSLYSRVQQSGRVRSQRHTIRLRNLTPGADYEYRVRGGRSRGQWARFRTRSKSGTRFRFAALGDIGDMFPNDARAAARLLDREAPDFAVALGDLAYPLSREGLLTDRFFQPLRRYAGSHVMWHVFGNHDVAADGGRPLELASESPENGPSGMPRHRNYSFDYGGAHFAVVDSNVPRRELRTVVAPWLERDLRRSDAVWKIVMMHHPPFSSGKHGDNRKLQGTLVPVLARCGVDLVLSGHDHDYERFKPIDGVTYVVSGAGGAGLYGFKDVSPRSAVREGRHHGLTVIDIDGRHAVLRQVTDTGREADRFELVARPRSAWGSRDAAIRYRGRETPDAPIVKHADAR